MDEFEIRKEWESKYDFEAGKLKPKADLSNECASFVISHPEITDEWIRIENKARMHDIYQKIIEIISNYVDVPEDSKKLIALWIIGTYFHDEFEAYPYLFFNAMRGSGKTRILKLISALGAKGDGSVQNNLTEAVIFRIPKGTVTCLDEIEQIGLKEKQTLRELLNSAYKKGMKVKRMEKKKSEQGEKYETTPFEPYFPVAMANIWGMDEVLGDRSISLILEKSDNPLFTKKIEDFKTNPEIIALKRKVSVVSVMSLRKKTYIGHWNDYIKAKYTPNSTTTSSTLETFNNTMSLKFEEEELKFFNKVDETGINGRNFELMFPLMLIASDLGDEVFDDILRICKSKSEQKKSDEYAESKDVMLYQFTAEQTAIEYITLKDFTARFRIFVGDTDEDRDEKWLNEKWVGRALKRLNLLLGKKRLASGRLILLDVAKAKEKSFIFKESHHASEGKE